jgi:large subunit ribosomal protein L15
MIQLNNLNKTTTKSSKRVGRGYGSGKGGHTSSRGQKGQKSRSNVAIWFEGGQLPQIRRFPFIKGKGRFQSLKPNVTIINVGQLQSFKKDSTVNVKSLIKAGLITEKEASTNTIKILGEGELKVALNVQLPTSRQAQSIIEKAGGKVSSGQAASND